MPQITFDRYYRYAELTALVQAFAAEYPDLVTLESIGKSYEGRDIWLLTVTNKASGAHDEKPALWVDGNIHATEVSPSSAALYLLNKLTTQYGHDADVTRAVDTRTFYICPRVNPDGAELALADVPRAIRSSTRPFPYDEEPLPGFESKDIDGDGRILMMRVVDPNGQWKTHPDEPRLMVRRDPIESGGTYYRVFPEGEIHNYDGVTVRPQVVKEGLDLNRNFPSGWRLPYQQNGSGLYPTSEPEVRAIVDFIAKHTNITGGVAFHTWSGVLLRPFDDKPDSEFPTVDLKTYKRIGDKGTEITGYPNISVFHDFKYDPKEVISGVFDDWMYDHMGVFAWTVEIWSPQRQAGITDYKYIEWYQEHPFEDDLKLLQWSDDTLAGKGYVAWYSFEHPQLGTVELGGWDNLYAWRNPPPHLLEKEIAPFSDWLVWQALISPLLTLHTLEVTPLGGDAYRVRVVAQNVGWLPTHVTERANEKKIVRGVVFEIDLPTGAHVVNGDTRVIGPQLVGRSTTASTPVGWGFRADTADLAKCEWVVQAPQGSTATVTVRHPRAGVVRGSVTFEG